MDEEGRKEGETLTICVIDVHAQYKSALATLSELQPRFQPRHNGKTRNSNKLVARSHLSLGTIYLARILSLVGFANEEHAR